MTCKVDNEKIFENEEFYTIKCEACKYFCKIPHYRQCELRFQWNKERGIDIFEPWKELDKIAKMQLGQGTSSTPNQSDSNKTNPPRHRRGRR